MMGRNLALVACAAMLALAPGRSIAAQTYKVKKGDTLNRIARTLKVNVDDLKEANGLHSNLLQPGTKLKVPERTPKHRAKETTAPEPGGREDARAETGNEERSAARSEPKTQKEPAKKAAPVSHVVKKGETLKAIAEAFDVPVKDLQRLNGIGKRGRLKPGTTLVVRTGERGKQVASARKTVKKVYVVQKGDNLFRIGKKLHVSTAELKRLNSLKSDALRLGQKLVVEEGAVARAEDDAEDAEDRITECRVDEAKINAELRELGEKAQQEGEDVAVTDRMMAVAKRMLGTPYRFGGSSTRGIDCSAYVQKVFRFLNLPLPRTAREQYAVGKDVSKDELSTGDLVFFRTYARYPSHVGIYLGDSKFIHASSMGKKVTIDSLDTPFYNKRYIGAKRLVQEEAEEPETEAARPAKDSAS